MNLEAHRRSIATQLRKFADRLDVSTVTADDYLELSVISYELSQLLIGIAEVLRPETSGDSNLGYR